MPGVTTFISIPAGTKRVPVYGWFMLVTVLDTLLRNAVFIGVVGAEQSVDARRAVLGDRPLRGDGCPGRGDPLILTAALEGTQILKGCWASGARIKPGSPFGKGVLPSKSC